MNDFILLLPEVFLAITCLGIIASEVGYHGESLRLITTTTLVGLAGAFVQTLLIYRGQPTQVFEHTISIDGFSLFFKFFFIILGALTVMISAQATEIAAKRRAEHCALILASVISMSLAVSATDLLVAFLAIQFTNALGYFLAGFGKKMVHSTEAAVKYMIFGTVSGALLLFGIAILFIATHTLNIYEMHRILVTQALPKSTGLVVFMMILLSFCMQFAAFPMHLWASDVLEGAPTPVSAFLSVGPRAMGFAVATRLLIVLFAQPKLEAGQGQPLWGLDWLSVLALISGITMLIGALLAIRQKGAKRMVSCLIISQTGFLLLGLLVLDQIGIVALLYNLVVELFAIMGIFYILSLFYGQAKSDHLDDLKGMIRKAVPECICLVLFLVCLVGLPPLPGFIGKFALIGTAIRHDWYALAMIAIVSIGLSVVALARLSFSLMGNFCELSPVAEFPNATQRLILIGLVVPMVLVGVFANAVFIWVGQSLRSIFW